MILFHKAMVSMIMMTMLYDNNFNNYYKMILNIYNYPYYLPLLILTVTTFSFLRLLLPH